MRQLENVVRSAVVLNNGEVVTPDMLPRPLGEPRGQHERAAADVRRPSPSASRAAAEEPPAAGAIRPLWQVEKQTIEDAVAACHGNVAKAAALLDISPSTIYRKRQAWEAAGKL